MKSRSKARSAGGRRSGLHGHSTPPLKITICAVSGPLDALAAARRAAFETIGACLSSVSARRRPVARPAAETGSQCCFRATRIVYLRRESMQHSSEPNSQFPLSEYAARASSFRFDVALPQVSVVVLPKPPDSPEAT